MSRTNVHSDNENNIICAGAQVIPTDREVEIPPKSAKMGPSTLDVKFGEEMEIVAGKSELREDGTLVNRSGEVLASGIDFKAVKSNRDNRNRQNEIDQTR